MKHTPISLIKDIKAFLAIKDERLAAISRAPARALPEKDGVNTLAAFLHPDFLTLEIVSKRKYPSSLCEIILKSSDDSLLPPYQAGQYTVLDGTKNKGVHSHIYFYANNTSHDPQKTYRLLVACDGTAANDKLINSEVGDSFVFTGPYGQCFFQPLRDSKKVLVFSELHQAGAMDSMLSLPETYTGVSVKGVMCKKQFSDALSGEKLIFAGENTSEAISKAMSKSPEAVIFIFGSESFCNKIRSQALDVGMKLRRIRTCCDDDVNVVGASGKLYKCRVITGAQKTDIVCSSEHTLAYALESAGIKVNIRCADGSCGYCRCKKIDGELEMKPSFNAEERLADKKYGYIHPCRAYPRSDLTIRF